MDKNLTARQTQILAFVEECQESHGSSPTLREICDHFGFRSLSSAQDHLRLIEQKGFLTKKPRSSRSIRVTRQTLPVDASHVVSVPLLGKIAAGVPTFALEESDEILLLPKCLFSGRSLFALRVDGDSMVNAGIYDHDIAVLKSQPSFNDGDIAAVVVDEEATLKRVFHSGKGMRLHPENEAYPDRFITHFQMDRSCRVAGILVGTVRRF